MTHRRFIAAALLALTASTADAGVQGCTVALGGGSRATLRIEERGRAIHALGMDLVQPVGGSVHDCSLGARRGDGRSRWRTDGAATHVTVADADAGPFEATIRRYRGDLQLSIGAPGGDLATCGTIAVPNTVIVTPKANGHCIARLPGRR